MVKPPPSILEQQTGERSWRWTLCNESRRNVVGPTSLAWIQERCETLRSDIVVLTGTGDRAFCAGFDLNQLGAEPMDAPPDISLAAATAAMLRADATFVAAIQGHAVGAGVELCSACDLRIAVSGIRFWVPAGRLGVVYHAEGLTSIHATFGPALTTRMLLLGHHIPAEDAATFGAVLQVCERNELGGIVDNLVSELRRSAPKSLRHNRNFLRALNSGAIRPEHLEAHKRARTEAFASEDHREAKRAVADRREPVFHDR